MPFSARTAKAANRFANPITKTFAGRIPPFAIVVHRGRTSGATYRNPVMAYPHGDEVVFALTYGSKVNWVKNTLAAGGCEIIRRGRTIGLSDPVIETHEDPPEIFGRLERRVLSRVAVTQYLRMKRVTPPLDE